MVNELSRAAWTRMAAAAATLALLMLAAGCSSHSGVAPQLTALGNPDTLISEVEERELGAQEHPKIVAAFGGAYSDPDLQSGIETVVARLARASNRPDIHYSVTILNSSSVNAFALPGGYIYATRGLLALANDADELAAVLAHEMGHVSSRHAAKRQSEAIRAVFLGRIANVLRDPASVGQALRDSDNVLASFSRAQELEADEIGVETAVRAGFDPFGAASFLESMNRDSDYRARVINRERDAYRPNLNSSHPATPDRIQRVMRLSRNLGFSPGRRARERQAYLGLINGLLYGDDPREGFVRGRSFLHPQLRVAFSVPEGFSLQNARDAVFAIGAEDTALRFDGVELPQDQPLTDYVASVWGRGASIREVRPVVVNGRSGIVARASHEGWDYRLAAIRFDGDKLYRFLYATRHMGEEDARAFGAMVNSLRTLSAREAAALKPLRVHIVTVGPGDTVAGFVARMQPRDNADERFRLLNELGPDAALRAGERVKIVAE